jgi:hypothetical protein
MLWKLKNQLPVTIKKKIYFTLFQTHLTYMISVWGSANDNVITPLQVIQNRALRNVFGIERLANRTQMYVGSVENCLPIRALHYVQSASYIYCNINRASHTNIILETNSLRGRYSNELRPATTRTNYGKRDITCIGVNIYNSVPKNIQVICSAVGFKSAPRCHIRTEEFLARCFNNNYLRIFSRTAS